MSYPFAPPTDAASPCGAAPMGGWGERAGGGFGAVVLGWGAGGEGGGVHGASSALMAKHPLARARCYF